MAATDPRVHLKRAYGFVSEVEASISVFRRRALEYEASAADNNKTFLKSMVDTVKGGRDLSAKKSKIMTDLQLALSEVAAAEAIDAEAALDTPGGTFLARHIRATVNLQQGIVEGLHGSSENARSYLLQSIESHETPDANYWIAAFYEGDYDPVHALQYYERCIEIDPAGEYSVAALRSANEMRNYRKRFRGDWGTFVFLFLLFFPAAILYYFVQRK